MWSNTRRRLQSSIFLRALCVLNMTGTIRKPSLGLIVLDGLLGLALLVTLLVLALFRRIQCGDWCLDIRGSFPFICLRREILYRAAAGERFS